MELPHTASDVWPWPIPSIQAPAEPSDHFVVTALVSTYDSERFMFGCLEDLVQQTLFRKNAVEVLVIDSGSPQNERAIVEKFQKEHPNIVYVRTEREPLYAAWNRGVRLARGRYLTNANTDDRHRTDALELMAACLDNRPGVALVYGDMFVTSLPNETFLTARDMRLDELNDFSRLNLLGKGGCGPHPMWRKALHYELGGFSEEFRVAGDYEWWLRVCEKYPLYHIREPLSLYLKRPDSIEHRQLEVCASEAEMIRRFYCARFGVPRNEVGRGKGPVIPGLLWRLRRSIRKRVKPWVIRRRLLRGHYAAPTGRLCL